MSELSTDASASGLAERVRRGRPAKPRVDSSEPTREPQGRAKRVPLGSQQLKLAASQRPGFVRRWINDTKNRISLAKQAGYEFVRQDMQASTTDMGQAVSVLAGTKEEGGVLRTYLMEIREDWYTEDQLAKLDQIDATESLLKRGEDSKGKAGQDGRYVPKLFNGNKIGRAR